MTEWNTESLSCERDGLHRSDTNFWHSVNPDGANTMRVETTVQKKIVVLRVKKKGVSAAQKNNSAFVELERIEYTKKINSQPLFDEETKNDNTIKKINFGACDKTPCFIKILKSRCERYMRFVPLTP